MVKMPIQVIHALERIGMRHPELPLPPDAERVPDNELANLDYKSFTSANLEEARALHEGAYTKAFPNEDEREPFSNWEEGLARGRNIRELGRDPNHPEPALFITPMRDGNNVIGFVVSELYYDAKTDSAVALVGYCVRDEDFSRHNGAGNRYYPPRAMLEAQIKEMQGVARANGTHLSGVFWEADKPEEVAYHGPNDPRNESSMNPATRCQRLVTPGELTAVGAKRLNRNHVQPPNAPGQGVAPHLYLYSVPMPAEEGVTYGATARDERTGQAYGYADAQSYASFERVSWQKYTGTTPYLYATNELNGKQDREDRAAVIGLAASIINNGSTDIYCHADQGVERQAVAQEQTAFAKRMRHEERFDGIRHVAEFGQGAISQVSHNLHAIAERLSGRQQGSTPGGR